MKRRLVALGLALCMICSSLSMTAFASKNVDDENLTEDIGAVEAEDQESSISLLSGENLSERSTLFNDGWKFRLGDTPGAEKTDFDDSSWRKLDLPHDWSIELDFNYKSAATSECGYLDGGTGWYRKSFILPESMKNKEISIDFGGVYMNSNTFVNGELVGNYPYGYMPFSYDIASKLVFDGVTENVIAVQAVNQLQSSRWYSGSGIYRDVHLTVTDKVHVDRYGTTITTPDISSGSGKIEIATKVSNDTTAQQKVKVRQTVLDDKGETVSNSVESGEITLTAGETKGVEQETAVTNPKLWSTKSPNLYFLRTEIIQNNKTIDSYDSRFGFRYFEFTNDNGFYLNGEWMKLYGVCMHHDQGSLGAVANEAAMERQMRIMKDMGVNAIRVTHNPADDKLLEICDRLGLMVIDEAFDTWTGKKTYDYGRFFSKKATHPDAGSNMTWGEFDVKQMVERGKNAPSIIMWSIGNEIGNTGNQSGLDTAKNLVKWIKEVDTTRPTTIGEDKFRGNMDDTNSNLGNNFMKEVFNTVDVPGLNYSENRYDAQHKEMPQWKLYGSEIASATSSRGIYAHPDNTGKGDSGSHPDYQQSSYDTDCVPWGRTAQDSLVRDRDRKFVAGEFVWTGFDYIGEPTPWNQSTTTPPKSSYFGIVDTAGLPKDSYYLYQSQWTSVEDAPMVHILPHWNWEDTGLLNKIKDSNNKVPIRVYTNARSVELYFKEAGDTSEGMGSLVETKKTFDVITPYKEAAGVKDNQDKEYQQSSTGKLYLEWRLPYTPGTLTAVAFDKDGHEIAKDVVQTAGKAASVTLKPEKSVIQADGSDISYIEVDITDENGNLVPTAANEVIFNVSGNGKIVGVDNGDASSHERYKDTNGIWKRKAFSGKAVVLVQSTKEAGSFQLTATSEGLKSDSTNIYTAPADVEGDKILGYNGKPVVGVVGEAIVLPEQIEAIYGDGITRKMFDVTWDKIPPAQLEKPGRFMVAGKVSNNDRVEIQVTIIGILGIKDVTKAVGVGEIPTLPTEVELVYSDGSQKMIGVTWPEITQEQVSKPGEFTLVGTLEGVESRKAKAIIRVTEELTYSKNIASRSGTDVYPKPSASFNFVEDYITNHTNNMSSNINDGLIARVPSWNNWTNGGVGNAKDSWIQLEFESPENIGKIGMHFYTDSATRKPAVLVVQTSLDGKEWTDVKNQDHMNDFGDAVEDWAKEYPVNFEPVTAKYVRVKMEGQTIASQVKPVGVSELKVYTGVAAASEEAALSDLMIDGKTVEGFAADKYNYTLQIGYPYQIPEITATAAEYGTLFVIPADSLEQPSVIKVKSESGTMEKTYSVHFEKLPLKLNQAELTMANTNLKENESEVITLTSKMEDGTVLDSSLASAEYSIESKDGAEAKIVRGKLNAIKAGTVIITAKVTYQGLTIESDPLTVFIAKSQEEIVITSYNPVTIITKPGEMPVLPETVTAQVAGSFERDVPVRWDRIEEEDYADFGSFEVSGMVEGQKLRPTLTVKVEDIIAATQFAGATPPHVIPDMPKMATVFKSDGTAVEVPVTWQEVSQEMFNAEEGTIVNVNGTAELDGTVLPVLMKVRVTSQDSVRTKNLYELRNGYELPFAIASFTNDEAASTDRVTKLNDANISFAQTDAAGKNVWCNWQRAPRTGDWVGVIMADEGQVTEKFVDTLSVGFFKEGTAGDVQYPAEYKIEYYTGPLDFELPGKSDAKNPRGHIETFPDSPLNNDANWSEVSYAEDGEGAVVKPVPKDEAMTDISFQPVKTCIVRIKMSSPQGKSLGITEIEAYGKSAVAKSEYTVNDITLDGVSLAGFSADKMQYQVELKKGDVIPQIAVKTPDNASVIIVPATNVNLMGKAIITAENGSLDTERTYSIQFTYQQDRSLLEQYIKEAEGKDSSKYTSESFERMTEALEAAKAVSNKATQDEIDQAARTLRNAINALVEKVDKVDKTQLVKALQNADNIINQADLYTPDSTKGIAAAYSKAQKVMADEHAVQQDVNLAADELNNEAAKARKKADKKALSELADQAAKKDLSIYTPESAANLKNVLGLAQHMVIDANISVDDQKKVDEMVVTLQKALNNLVLKPTPEPPVITPVKTTSQSVAAGKSITLKLTVDYNKPVTWSSSNSKYASVNSKGVLTAKKAGIGKTVTITAKAVDGSGSKAIIKVKILKSAVKKITLESPYTTVYAGKKISLKAAFTPSKNISKMLSYKSSNTKYATVNSKGQVTTKKEGAGKSVTITASATDGSKKKASIKIHIVKNAVEKISLKAPKKTIDAGRKITIKATMKPSKNINKRLKWSTNNRRYATVNSKGVVSTKSAGKGKTVKITAKALDGSGKSSTISLKIK